MKQESTTFESREFSPDAFVAFRAESTAKLTAWCERFYSGNMSETVPGIEPALQDAAIFVADAFRGQARKDGRPLAIHSLQLPKSADYLGIADPDVHRTALFHDLGEDAGIHPDAIAARFGAEAGRYAAAMTEDRTGHAERAESLGSFIEQLRGAGRVAVIVELLDRMDDLADAAYLTRDLTSDDPTARERARDGLAKKIAKCRFTVAMVTRGVKDQDVEFLTSAFNALERSRATSWEISPDAIENHLTSLGASAVSPEES